MPLLILLVLSIILPKFIIILYVLHCVFLSIWNELSLSVSCANQVKCVCFRLCLFVLSIFVSFSGLTIVWSLIREEIVTLREKIQEYQHPWSKSFLINVVCKPEETCTSCNMHLALWSNVNVLIVSVIKLTRLKKLTDSRGDGQRPTDHIRI